MIITRNGPLRNHTRQFVHDRVEGPFFAADDDYDSIPLWKDERPWVRWPMYTLHVILITLSNSYVYCLLIFVPLGITAGVVRWNATAVFILNFIAIIPLAALLNFATDELSAHFSNVVGGLLDVLFGKAVELIVSICNPKIWF